TERKSCEKRVAIGSADADLSRLLSETRDIGCGLCPGPVAQSSAHSDDRRGRRASLGVSVEDVPGREGDALERGSVDVRARVRQSQADNGAFGVRIVNRRPLAGEIGEKNEPIGAG